MDKNQYVLALIDDDPKILELTAKYLKDQEFTVYTGKNGKDLDEILKKICRRFNYSRSYDARRVRFANMPAAEG